MSISLYKDTGCDLHPKCLECPLPMCKYDDPDRRVPMRRDVRDAQIIDLLAQGVKIPNVAAEVGTSERTVYRIRSLA